MKEETPTSGKFHQLVRNSLIRRAEELCYAKLFVKTVNEITFRNTDLVVCLEASHELGHLGQGQGLGLQKGEGHPSGSWSPTSRALECKLMLGVVTTRVW